MEASEFFLQTATLIKEYFPGQFRLKKDQLTGEATFYRAYPERNLILNVHIPIIHNTPDSIHFAKKKLITVFVARNTKTCLELRPSRIITGWESVLKEKIAIVKSTIDDMKRCIICNDYPIPKMSMTMKRNAQGTKFVSYYCPRCRKYFNSTYGVYLKSILHKYL